MKKQIENLYINAVYHNESPNTFSSRILELIGVDEKKQTRSSSQSRARWKYLTIVASILNDKGYGFKANGIAQEVKYNKDILYQVYWLTLKDVLYPNMSRQLNTKEFANLADHICDLFAIEFQINIPFPNIVDYLSSNEH